VSALATSAYAQFRVLSDAERISSSSVTYVLSVICIVFAGCIVRLYEKGQKERDRREEELKELIRSTTEVIARCTAVMEDLKRNVL